MRQVLISLTALTILGVCLGLGCSTPPVVDPDSPIPEGEYSGSLTGTFKTYINNEFTDQETESIADTLCFGADGLLLTDTNEPVYIGYTKETGMTSMRITTTITEINTLQHSLVIQSTAEMEIENQGATLTATGEAGHTYTLQADGSIIYRSEMVLGGEVEGDSIMQIVTYSGTYTQ
jgi:hypothetical protein